MYVYITNLGLYNEGNIVGDWFALGQPIDKLKQFLKKVVKINEQYEEYFISDVESDNLQYEVNPYCNLFELNHLISCFNDLSESEQMTVNALLQSGTINTLGDAMDNVDSYQLIPEIKTEYDLGYYFLAECDFLNIPDYMINYIDFESYGRDILLSDDGELTEFGYLMCL